MKELPCCYFPTQVVFVDDNMTFLESLSLELDFKTKSCIFYDDPDFGFDRVHQAVRYENNDDFTHRVIQYHKTYERERGSISIKIGSIFEEIYNPHRFETLAALVVDYDMPKMNGISFSMKAEGFHIRRILLTGAADEQIAINAFNDGFIDRYISKSVKNLSDVLDTSIAQIQLRYFVERSKTVMDTIKVLFANETALTDPIFVEFFLALLQQYNIREFYLLDGVGSFLLVDKEGKLLNFFLKTEEQMQAHYWEAKDEEELSDSLKEELRQFEKILCFHIRDNEPIPLPTEWEPYLHPAEFLQGSKNNYYWAVVKNVVKLDPKRILDFKHFLNASQENLT